MSLRRAVLACLCALPYSGALDNGVARTPPMGFNTWNHFGCRVSADVLKTTADVFVQYGLVDLGYVYINTDDCWSNKGRDANGRIEPSSTFLNGTKMTGISQYMEERGMKFGIYGAAGQTTCARREGSLYHERIDAQTFSEWGVKYLKYDNCGEVNIQSYAKFSAMSDALNATGKHIVFSFEPHLTEPISWPVFVGNLWRTGHDIRSSFSSMFSDLAINDAWATVGGIGGWNDADMLEIGNNGLSISEQRVHFALWCMVKSPLLIGADVRAIDSSSLAILKNAELIAVNQDSLGVQAALRKTYSINGTAMLWQTESYEANSDLDGVARNTVNGNFNGMTTCDYGYFPPEAQRWKFTNNGMIIQGTDTCLLALSPPILGSCRQHKNSSHWDVGFANLTTAQIKTLPDEDGNQKCLKYVGPSYGIEATGLFLDECNTEPDICSQTRCANSNLVNELWYLSRHGQLISSWTAVPIPPADKVNLDPAPWKDSVNPPYCLATKATLNPPQPPSQPRGQGSPDVTQCLQVWAGPLAPKSDRTNYVVGLVNICDKGTQTIVATWDDIGIKNKTCNVRDLYQSKNLEDASGYVKANVPEHDIVALRLECKG